MSDPLIRLNLAFSLAILAVLLLRRPVRRAFGGGPAYALWALVPAAVLAGLLPARTVIVKLAYFGDTIRNTVQITPIDRGVSYSVPEIHVFDPVAFLATVWPALWLAGVVVSAGVIAWRQARFLRRLGPLTRADGGLWRASLAGAGPALVGGLFPRIVIPADFEDRYAANERKVMLAHERAHLTRGDAQINGLAALIQCLSWYNPLVHLGVRALRIDQELACDAAVVAALPKSRGVYAGVLLKSQLAELELPLGCYWPARAERPLKTRLSLLAAPARSRRMRLAGAAIATGVALAGGLAAWAAEPPRTVVVAADTPPPIAPRAAPPTVRVSPAQAAPTPAETQTVPRPTLAGAAPGDKLVDCADPAFLAFFQHNAPAGAAKGAPFIHFTNGVDTFRCGEPPARETTRSLVSYGTDLKSKPGEDPAPQPARPDADNGATSAQVAAQFVGTFLRSPTESERAARTLAAALNAGEAYKAAQLGASAADIVRLEQARGNLPGLDPETTALTILPNGAIGDVYSLKPLPALTPNAGDLTVPFVGFSDGFGKSTDLKFQPGAIILRPSGTGSPTSTTLPPGVSQPFAPPLGGSNARSVSMVERLPAAYTPPARGGEANTIIRDGAHNLDTYEGRPVAAYLAAIPDAGGPAVTLAAPWRYVLTQADGRQWIGTTPNMRSRTLYLCNGQAYAISVEGETVRIQSAYYLRNGVIDAGYVPLVRGPDIVLPLHGGEKTVRLPGGAKLSVTIEPNAATVPTRPLQTASRAP